MHANLNGMLDALPGRRLLALSSKVSRRHTDMVFQEEDILLFGPESRGLPAELLATLPEQHKLRIPMMPESRSLNLSNAVAVVLYEALRQQDFAGMR